MHQPDPRLPELPLSGVVSMLPAGELDGVRLALGNPGQDDGVAVGEFCNNGEMTRALSRTSRPTPAQYLLLCDRDSHRP